MGNNDGLKAAIADNNKQIPFEGGYFSMAFNSEIALVLGSSFYILNVGEDIFKEIKKMSMNKEDAIKYWLACSAKYDISIWSSDFNELTKEIYDD